jgi:cell division septation protein DedD
MSYLHEDYSSRDEGIAAKEHELTLSTAAIFGLFFAQVVLCAIFFGFGYSMGGHKTPSALPAETAEGKGADFSSFKPAAGTATGSAVKPQSAPVAPVAETSVDKASKDKTESAAAPIVKASAPAVTPVALPHTAGAPATAAAAPAGLFVQVAAISQTHPDDATMLQNALKAKGYAVTQRSGPDTFIHLLLGPYSDRAAAEAMRQKLATDGYVAYIK